MKSLILSIASRLVIILMEVFSVYLLLRGHNLPGGGFVGGLVAGTALVLLGIAEGPAAVRRTLLVDPRSVALGGVAIAVAAGMLGLIDEAPFLTGVWWFPSGLPLGTPLLFDVGVFLVVVGAVATLFAALEDEEPG